MPKSPQTRLYSPMVPPDSTAVGAPAKIIKIKGARVNNTAASMLNHADIPNVIEELYGRINALENKLRRRRKSDMLKKFRNENNRQHTFTPYDAA